MAKQQNVEESERFVGMRKMHLLRPVISLNRVHAACVDVRLLIRIELNAKPNKTKQNKNETKKSQQTNVGNECTARTKTNA